MEDFFDKVLHYYGRKGEKLFMINIGAMDGVLFDSMSGYADMYNSDVLYVEPMKPHFDRLVKHKGGNPANKFENSAISNYNGTINMKTIPIEIVDQGLVHQAFYGMSVIDPTKNGMGSEGDREVVEKYAVDIEVNCITWDTLVKKHNIDYFDVLSVDTEGHDYTIFKQIDLEKFRPILIRLEWCNMTDEEKTNILNKFTSSGYVYEILDNMDIDAVRKDVYEEIKSKLEPKQIIETSNSKLTIETSNSKLTLVTGLWDIGRGDLQEGWSRSFQHYLDKFQQLLQVDVNMIIFGDKELEEFVLNNRSSENTQFVIRDLSWFKNNDFYDKIQKIRTNPDWYNQISWLTNSTQAKLEMYNPLVMSKVYLLHDAKILDKFDSEYMFWIDAGLTNTIHPGYFTQDKVLDKLPQLVKNFHFVCFPYETNSEIHGFKYQELCDLAGKPVNMVARAGFFGGKKDVISEINSIYYGLMNDTLSQGLMGTEESLFTIMTYKYPNLITYSEIESNGLMGKFFEDLKNMTVETKINDISSEIGLYVITFNSPKQFETLIESMLDYDPSFLTKTKKYLLNNSTDLSTTERYIQLCDQYEFEHIKKDNIGITGGRQFIAEHFNEQNNLSHYYFFEDDMFFYNGGEITCKNGFVRKIKNIFDNTLKIIKEENFDFLKLNFSEFYGSHNKQWAWYNVPQSFRESHWVNNPRLPEHGLDANSPNLEFKHIKSYNGIPYATGEIYLCNWPIVMSKEGNYKCYLKTKYSMPYEQTLMSHCYQEMVKGNISGSVLLSTPTDHNRFDFYDGNLRKEC
jgi:FkbM family methyltransferase